jgi:hypothetical protein
MANAKQCDICGKFYAAHKLSKNLRGYGMRDTATVFLYDPDPNAEYPGELEGIEEGFETCCDCMSKIKNYIATMKKEN